MQFDLFLIVGGLFLLNLVVPDLIPFYDEILMAMLAVLIASIRQRSRRRSTRLHRSAGYRRHDGPTLAI
jgi:hypothetical protein